MAHGWRGSHALAQANRRGHRQLTLDRRHGELQTCGDSRQGQAIAPPQHKNFPRPVWQAAQTTLHPLPRFATLSMALGRQRGLRQRGAERIVMLMHQLLMPPAAHQHALRDTQQQGAWRLHRCRIRTAQQAQENILRDVGGGLRIPPSLRISQRCNQRAWVR